MFCYICNDLKLHFFIKSKKNKKSKKKKIKKLKKK